MRRLVTRFNLALVLLGTLFLIRPASADAFTDQAAAAQAYIRANGACFRCDGEATLLSLINGALLWHSQANTARTQATIDAALGCLDTPSSEFVCSGGGRTPVSQVFGYTIYRIFGYQLPAPNAFTNNCQNVVRPNVRQLLVALRALA